MAGRLIYADTRSKKTKPSKNKRLAAAKLDHAKWLEEQRLSSKQISSRRMKDGYLNRLPDLKVNNPVPLSNGFAPTPGKRTMMERRFKESPEVRAEIEKKAMRIGQTVNKGVYGYISDGDQTKYEGRVRK